ncbi:MAG TPA: D-glycero-beta-D-manno-heptose-7-phosphate kinase [Sumerlaeia bacterium]|nr:D-glycero-beta-D-manno-heptose-7-phosphate kinase [Sumerlaeia bacterium]
MSRSLLLPSQGRLTLQDLLARDLRPLAGARVLVVGDPIVDHYLWGSVERTTPEAPVPVVRHERESAALGGAANVAHNVVALGGRVDLAGVVGRDEEGARLRRTLREKKIGVGGLIAETGRPTTVKTRVISMGQQLLRIDREETAPVSARTADRIIEAVRRLVGRCGVVVLSDYAKGTLSAKVVAAAVRAAHERGVPVLADPKGRDYARYGGCDLLTPNRREMALATGLPVSNEEEMRKVGRELIRRCRLGALVATLSEEGLAVIRPRGRVLRIPARAPEVFDRTGAGDTTVAALALGLAAGLSLEDAAVLANHAGGIVCGKLGVATVSPAELRGALEGGAAANKVRTADELKILLANLQTAGRKIVFTNGCFDLLHPGHIHFLHEAKRLGDVLVVGVNTDRSVRALKGPPRPILAQDERAAILSALEVVDHIVFFDDLTPEALLRGLRPDVLVKGRNIPEDQVVGREIVQSYGGRVCRLPILHPATVTDLVESIVGKSRKAGSAS